MAHGGRSRSCHHLGHATSEVRSETNSCGKNQITKPYYKEYFEITEPMFLKPREFQVFEPVGPGFTMIKANH